MDRGARHDVHRVDDRDPPCDAGAPREHVREIPRAVDDPSACGSTLIAHRTDVGHEAREPERALADRRPGLASPLGKLARRAHQMHRCASPHKPSYQVERLHLAAPHPLA